MSMGITELSTKVAAITAGSALGVPGAASVIEPLLRELLLVQNEQAATIARIDANVERLIQGPWETSRSYLEEAALPRISDSQRIEKLQEARRELQRAIPLQPEATLPRAYAALELTLIDRLLGDIPSSELSASRALDAATQCVVREMVALNKRGRAKGRCSRGVGA